MILYVVTSEMSPYGFDVYTDGWEEVKSIWRTQAEAEAARQGLASGPDHEVLDCLHIREWRLGEPAGVPDGMLLPPTPEVRADAFEA